MCEKKVCKICNEHIVENSFARDSKNHYYFHTTCLEKLILLLKIKNSIVLNRVDFKSLEIIFEILSDDIPIDIISNLEEGLNADLPIEWEIKGVIETLIFAHSEKEARGVFEEMFPDADIKEVKNLTRG